MYGPNLNDSGNPPASRGDRGQGDCVENAEKSGVSFKTISRDNLGFKRQWSDKDPFARVPVAIPAISRDDAFVQQSYGRMFLKREGSTFDNRSQLTGPKVFGVEKNGPISFSGELSLGENGVDPRDVKKLGRDTPLISLVSTIDNPYRVAAFRSSEKKRDVALDPRLSTESPAAISGEVKIGAQTSVVLHDSSKSSVVKSDSVNSQKMVDVWEFNNTRDSVLSKSESAPPQRFVDVWDSKDSANNWRSLNLNLSNSVDSSRGKWFRNAKPADRIIDGDITASSPLTNSDTPLKGSLSGSPPAKKTRLGWGQGLAKYEGSKQVEPKNTSAFEDKKSEVPTELKEGNLNSEETGFAKIAQKESDDTLLCTEVLSENLQAEPASNNNTNQEENSSHFQPSTLVELKVEHSKEGQPLPWTNVTGGKEGKQDRPSETNGAFSSITEVVTGTAATYKNLKVDLPKESPDEKGRVELKPPSTSDEKQVDSFEIALPAQPEADKVADVADSFESAEQKCERLKCQMRDLLLLEKKILTRCEADLENQGVDVSNFLEEIEDLFDKLTVASLRKAGEECQPLLKEDKSLTVTTTKEVEARLETPHKKEEPSSPGDRESPEKNLLVDGAFRKPPVATFVFSTRKAIQKIYLQNRQKAWQTWGSTSHKLLYLTPSMCPAWKNNKDSFSAIEEQLYSRITEMCSLQMSIEKALALRFRALSETWEILDKVPEKPLSNKVILKPGSGRGRNGYQQKDSLELALKFSISVETQMEMVEKSLSRLLEHGWKNSLEIQMPPMFLGSRNRSFRSFVNTNSLVENPRELERERKAIRPWTMEEKELFYEKYGEYGKDFASISTHLPCRTVGDCIEFFYLNQKSKEFRKPKKKKELHRNSFYMATTRTRSYRAREANAIENLPPLNDIPKGSRTPLPRARDQFRPNSPPRRPDPSFSVKIFSRGESEDPVEDLNGFLPVATEKKHKASLSELREKMNGTVKAEEKSLQESERKKRKLEQESASLENSELLEHVKPLLVKSLSAPSVQGELSSKGEVLDSESLNQKVALDGKQGNHVDFELPLSLDEGNEEEDANQTGRESRKEFEMEAEGTDSADLPREIRLELPESDSVGGSKTDSGRKATSFSQLKGESPLEDLQRSSPKPLNGKVPGKLPRGRPPKDKSRGRKKSEGTTDAINPLRARSNSPLEDGEFCLPESFRLSATSNEDPPAVQQNNHSVAPKSQAELQPQQAQDRLGPSSQDLFVQEFSLPKRSSVASLEQQMKMLLAQRNVISSFQTTEALQSAISALSQPLTAPSLQTAGLLHQNLVQASSALAQHHTLAQLSSSLMWPSGTSQILSEETAKNSSDLFGLQGLYKLSTQKEERPPPKGDVKLFGQSLLPQQNQVSPSFGQSSSADLNLEDADLEMQKVAMGIMRRANLEGNPFSPSVPSSSGQTWNELNQFNRASELKTLDLLRRDPEAAAISNAWQLSKIATQNLASLSLGRNERANLELFSKGGLGENRLESLGRWSGSSSSQAGQPLEDLPQSVAVAQALSLALERQRQQQQQQQQPNINSSSSAQFQNSGSDPLNREMGSKDK